MSLRVCVCVRDCCIAGAGERHARPKQANSIKLPGGPEKRLCIMLPSATSHTQTYIRRASTVPSSVGMSPTSVCQTGAIAARWSVDTRTQQTLGTLRPTKSGVQASPVLRNRPPPPVIFTHFLSLYLTNRLPRQSTGTRASTAEHPSFEDHLHR
jgi:hypothetical protein